MTRHQAKLLEEAIQALSNLANATSIPDDEDQSVLDELRNPLGRNSGFSDVEADILDHVVAKYEATDGHLDIDEFIALHNIHKKAMESQFDRVVYVASDGVFHRLTHMVLHVDLRRARSLEKLRKGDID